MYKKTNTLNQLNSVEKELTTIVPDRIKDFHKLQSGDPYYFDRWDTDQKGRYCLYYWFHSKDKAKINKKRVITSEIYNLLQEVCKEDKEIISRADFKGLCPITMADGPCGYAVIIRLLEALKVARYIGSQGAKITDMNRVKGFLHIS